MTDEQHKVYSKSIARIRNVAYIMGIMFKEMSDLRNNPGISRTLIDSEIERKEKAYDYLKKYGSLTLKDVIKELDEIFITK
jgi:hypothetical protein